MIMRAESEERAMGIRVRAGKSWCVVMPWARSRLEAGRKPRRVMRRRLRSSGVNFCILIATLVMGLEIL